MNQANSNEGGAKSGALDSNSAPQIGLADADLLALAEVWPHLTGVACAKIMQIARVCA
jgi:hypothetical protein